MSSGSPMPTFAHLRRALETASELLDLLPDSLKLTWKWANRKTRGDWPDAESADGKALQADIEQNRTYLDELMLTLASVSQTAKALKCRASTEPLSRLFNKRLAFGGPGMESVTENEIADAALCLTELFSEIPAGELAGGLGAGEAFLAVTESDPAAKAAWERARAKLIEYLKAFQGAARGSADELRQKLEEMAVAMRDGLRASGDELAAQGFNPPASIEDWEHLARIVEIPIATIRSGDLTAREIHACALAWADRQTIERKLTAKAATIQPAPTGKPAMSKKAKALAALTDHPGWTDEQIAHAAGCHVKSLYRWKDFVRARELLREGRGDALKGSKDGKNGDVEAWDDDESDDDDE